MKDGKESAEKQQMQDMKDGKESAEKQQMQGTE